MNIYIAGSKGMVGSAVKSLLTTRDKTRIVFDDGIDLRDQNAVRSFFKQHNIDAVVVAAARVGGIIANSKYPYDFIYDNIMIEANIINAAIALGIEKLIFLGSSCIYPKLAPQPLKEEYLLTGELEPTNEWYAIAKIAGIKLCQASNRQHGTKFISLMPTNLYGEVDNFDLESSHVMPAMIRKFHEALPNKDVVLWGSGSPMREFMHVRDLANAIKYLLEHDIMDDLYNVGTGEDLSIKKLAHMIQKITGHTGAIIWDIDKPDGTPRKLLDVGKLHDMGWRHQIELEETHIYNATSGLAEAGSISRVAAYARGFQVISESPFGYGFPSNYDEYGVLGYSPNAFMNHFIRWGIFGISVILISMWMTVRYLLYQSKVRVSPLVFLLLFGALMMSFHGTTLDSQIVSFAVMLFYWFRNPKIGKVGEVKDIPAGQSIIADKRGLLGA